MADHSGHVVPGADPAVPLQYRPFDARSDTSLTTTAAMARSFRNWVSREKAGRLRSRSNTPEIVVLGSRTTGPEDTPSGSRKDVVLADDDAAGIAGPTALRAIIHDAAFTDEDDSGSDADDDYTGFTGLDANDVSDEVMATAYSMLTTARNIDHGEGHWADILASNILRFLLHNNPAHPMSGSDSDAGDWDAHNNFPDEVKAALERFHLYPNPIKAANQKGKIKTEVGPDDEQAGINIGLDPRRGANGEYDRQNRNRGTGRQQMHKTRRTRKKDRQPNKPANPRQSVWDPTWWRINTKDPDDGVWARKLAAAHKQPTDKMETGFITWAEQEAKFPRLDARLRLHNVRGARPTIINHSTSDTQVWDLLNRMVVEPRTGTRSPLHLNPVTTHSLARWTMDRYGDGFSLDPIQLPDNPPMDDKKRPIPPATRSQSQGATNGKGKGAGKKVAFASAARIEIPTKGTPVESADESSSAIVASIHYPLRSPIATSISRPHPGGQHDTARPDAPSTSYAAFSNIRRSLPGPPTPYPRVVPDTPTVALYENGAASWNGDALSAVEEKADEEVEPREDEDRDRGLAAFSQDPHTSGGSGTGGSNENKKKRALELDLQILAGPSRKKRRAVADDSVDAESKEAERIKEAAAVEREPEPHHVYAGNEVFPYEEWEWESAPGDKEEEEEGPVLPDDQQQQQVYPLTPEQWDAFLRDDAAAAMPEPGPEPGAQEVYDTEDNTQLVTDPVLSQELNGPDDGVNLMTAHAMVDDAATTHGGGGGGGGEKKSVRFQLPAGPSPGMRFGARRALGRYGRTALRLGPLSP
ncbi:hypothetical protein F5B18DRAFT_616112 [Nemania serpens]|nr:hypothetical protein F5B18DRAFT_616112 [Nemania serpens]